MSPRRASAGRERYHLTALGWVMFGSLGFWAVVLWLLLR